jgi:hypothetical protein
LDAEEPDLGGGADGLEDGVVGYGKGEGARGDLLDVEQEGEFVKGHVVVAVEEGYGFAGFEFGVGFVVGEGEGDGEGKLVEGVVGGVAEGDVHTGPFIVQEPKKSIIYYTFPIIHYQLSIIHYQLSSRAYIFI